MSFWSDGWTWQPFSYRQGVHCSSLNPALLWFFNSNSAQLHIFQNTLMARETPPPLHAILNFLCLYFPKQNSILGSVVPLAMFISISAQLDIQSHILFSSQASRGTSASPLLFMTILVPFLLIKITAASVSVSYECMQNLVG